MPRKKPKLRVERGRPPFDKVAIYLYVEAGRRGLDISAHAFCMRHKLTILSHGNKPNEDEYEVRLQAHQLGGTTLYRRLMEAKKVILRRPELPEGMPQAIGWPSVLPDELEIMIEDLAAAT